MATVVADYAVLTLWVFSWPLRLVWSIVMAVLGVLGFLFAPAIYIVDFHLDILRRIVRFIASLEALYTFIACAAIVGLLAGAVVGMTSWFLNTILGTNVDDDEGDDANMIGYEGDDRKAKTIGIPRYDTGRPLGAAATPTAAELKAEWAALMDVDAPIPFPPGMRKRRGLQSLTIHEEEDDEVDYSSGD